MPHLLEEKWYERPSYRSQIYSVRSPIGAYYSPVKAPVSDREAAAMSPETRHEVFYFSLYHRAAD